MSVQDYTEDKFIPSCSEELQEMEYWFHHFLPRKVQSSDDYTKFGWTYREDKVVERTGEVNGWNTEKYGNEKIIIRRSERKFPTSPFRKIDKAPAYKFFNPTCNAVTRVFEDDFDFPYTEEWHSAHRPTFVIVDPVSDHFHAIWVLDKWTVLDVVQALRKQMKVYTGGDTGKTNFIVQSPFFNTTFRDPVRDYTKDGQLREQFFLVKAEMITYSVSELQSMYPLNVLNVELDSTTGDWYDHETGEYVNVDDVPATAEKSTNDGDEYEIPKDFNPLKQRISVPHGCRNTFMFEKARKPCYSLYAMGKLTFEITLQICKGFGSDQAASAIRATAKSIYTFIIENFTPGSQSSPKSEWANRRCDKCKEHHETLKNFSERVDISYSLANKYSRQRKPYLFGGTYFFKNSQICNISNPDYNDDVANNGVSKHQFEAHGDVSDCKDTVRETKECTRINMKVCGTLEDVDDTKLDLAIPEIVEKPPPITVERRIRNVGTATIKKRLERVFESADNQERSWPRL